MLRHLKIMNRKPIGILVLFLVLLVTLSATPAFSAQPELPSVNTRAAPTPVTKRVLVRNSNHLVVLKPAGDRVTLSLEALGDGTDNLGGRFPKIDFVSIRVDVNQNGKVDPKLDITYGIQGGSKDKLCTQ